MDNSRLYKLGSGDTFVVSMKAYKRQEDVFKELTEILRRESYYMMFIRCSKTVASYVIHAKPPRLKDVIDIFTRRVELKFIGK